MVDTQRNVSLAPDPSREEVRSRLTWTRSHLSPLPILHPALILAFTTFILVIALGERVPLSEGTARASELSGKFDLDVTYDEMGSLSGSDLAQVRRESDPYSGISRDRETNGMKGVWTSL